MQPQVDLWVSLFVVATLLSCERPSELDSEAKIHVGPWQKKNLELTSLQFLDKRQGWAVGKRGAIVATTDGGLTWEEQDSGITEDLWSVWFLPDGHHGWVLGSEGAIVATTNGGLTWGTRSYGTREFLFSVFFLNEHQGWAVGSQGTIISTTDGGISWDPQDSNTNEDLLSVQFFNEKRGWAVGARGTVVATSDGGANWERQTTGTGELLVGVQFVSERQGWAVGGKGTVIATTDGGVSWSEQNSGTDDLLQSMEFLNEHQGWAVGESGTIIVTSDGGLNWTLRASTSQNDLHSVEFVDEHQGWVVNSSGEIMVTTNGGISWNRSAPVPSAATLFSVQFINGHQGWAVGSEGTIITTTNSGLTWALQVSGTNETLFSVEFLDARRGWAVGEGGTIIATSDGGLNWSVQASSTDRSLASVQFVNESQGWAVGEGGTILATTDGGHNWARQDSETTVDLFSVRFLNQRGWAVGYDGAIVATVDGGLNWSHQNSGTNEVLYSVDFVNEHQGWAVGSEGEIVGTADGGLTWAPPLRPVMDVEEHFLSIHFLDARQGWAVGDSGTIVATFDGGLTWGQQYSVGIRLYSVHFHDESRDGWIVGRKGTILRSVNPVDLLPSLATFDASNPKKLRWTVEAEDPETVRCVLYARVGEKQDWGDVPGVEYQAEDDDSATFKVNWDPNEYGFAPGQEISYLVEIEDNKRLPVTRKVGPYRFGPRPLWERIALGVVAVALGNVVLVLLATRVRWIRAVMLHPTGRAAIGLVIGKYLITDWMIRFIAPLKLALFSSYRKNLAQSTAIKRWEADSYVPPNVRLARQRGETKNPEEAWESVLGELLPARRRRLWLIEGESGLGKTALLENWARRALELGETPVLIRLGSDLKPSEEAASLFNQFGDVDVSAETALDLVSGGGFLVLLDGFNEDPTPDATREFVKKVYKRNLVAMTSQFVPKWAKHLEVDRIILAPYGHAQLTALLGVEWAQQVERLPYLAREARLPVTAGLLARFVERMGEMPDYGLQLYEDLRQPLRRGGASLLNLDLKAWDLFLGNTMEFEADDSLPDAFCERAVEQRILTVRYTAKKARHFRFAHERLRDYFAAESLVRRDSRAWQDWHAEAEKVRPGLGRDRWGVLLEFFGEILVRKAGERIRATTVYEEFLREVAEDFSGRVFARVLYPQYDRFVEAELTTENSEFVRWAARILQGVAAAT